jgi:hypothetical protein
MVEWTLRPHAGESPEQPLKGRLKDFQKSNPVEVRNCFVNPQAFLDHLNLGGAWHGSGLARPEGEGLVALDQHGPDNPRLELRLYVFPDEVTGVVHVLTLGDKRTQKADVHACHQSIRQLRKQRETKKPQ